MLGNSGVIGAAADAVAQVHAYEKAWREKAAVETDPASSLLRLADQISEATARIDHLADNLNGLALALHGPRPEPVNDQVGNPTADSLSARITYLMIAVGRVTRAYEGIIR